MNNHSLPHRCDYLLKRAVIIELLRQRERVDKQTKLEFFGDN